MGKKLIEEDGSDATANFEAQTSPSDATELGVQIRVCAPRDVVSELQRILVKEGFTVAGNRPEKGFSDRERAYMIADLRRFRDQHGLSHIEEDDVARRLAEVAAAEKELTKINGTIRRGGGELAKVTKNLAGMTNENLSVKTLQKNLVERMEKELHVMRFTAQRLEKIVQSKAALLDFQRRLKIREDVKEAVGRHEIFCDKCGHSEDVKFLEKSKAPWMLQPTRIAPSSEFYAELTCENQYHSPGTYRFRVYPDDPKSEVPEPKSIQDLGHGYFVDAAPVDGRP